MKRRRTPSPDEPSRSAFQDALRFLARRGRSLAEVRERLADKGHGPEEIETAERRLFEENLIDDRALAEHYLAARSERLGHGPQRLFRELERRGVAEADIRVAWNRLIEEGEVDPETLLDRRVQDALRREGGSVDPGAYRRIYSRLLRAGFEPANIHRALGAHKDDDEIR